MKGEILKRQKRAKIMLPAIKQMIAIEASTSEKNREELAEELLEKIKSKYPKEIPPVTDTIVKLISKYRNRRRASLDRPWNLGELDNLAQLNTFSIDAEAIDYILEVQNYSASGGPPLQVSIRQAKWISRLYRIIKKNIKLLWFVSFLYTNYEVICEMADIPFNTRKLDAALRDPKLFSLIAQEINKNEFANEAFKKAFYYNINRYYSEIEEVI